MGDAFIVRRGGSGGNNKFPAYTYSGDSYFTDEGNGNWNISLLTSGTFRFTKLNSAANGIDVFCVGGGGGGVQTSSHGGGGGGGYTATHSALPNVNTDYPVVIGAGGAVNSNGSATSAFGVSANGGETGSSKDGGNGGSGGGVGSSSGAGGDGGSDGGNGTSKTGTGGTGQGTTTRAFGELDGTLYAGGGGGCSGAYNYDGGAGGAGGGGTGASGATFAGTSGTVNTGGGGGGGYNNTGAAGSGGSGIVIIRNHREES